MRRDNSMIALLVALPVLVRFPEWLGLVHANAMGYTSALSVASPGFIGGSPTIDPNIGFTSQALGAQAAHQWLSGQIPWWNPYEGVGMPLAGEMQSAAFFPLTLLLAIPWGQTAFHTVLQIVAGIATYYLLREMRLSRTASVTGAVIFEFNGVFAWLANAAVNPVAFLPLLLLGIERAFTRAQREATPSDHWRWTWVDVASGWKWIAIALALSLLAGFPETAYIDGLLAVVWFAVRAFMLSGWNARVRFAGKSGIGLILGVAVASPLLVAFAAYLPVSYVASHAQGTTGITLSRVALVQYLHPYLFGSIFQYGSSPEITGSWSGIGGFLGLSVAFLALMGLFARRELGLRIALGVWIAVTVGRSIGAEPFSFIMNKLPLMSSVASYRYANASWILAATALAALAIDDWRGTQADKLKLIACAACALVVMSLGSMALVLPQINALLNDPTATGARKYVFGSIAIEWGGVLIIGAALLLSKTPVADPAEAYGSQRGALQRPMRRPRSYLPTIVTGAVVMALSLAYFLPPMLANPRHVSVDYAGVAFLQAHSGYSRFYSLGPFWPNYGSYFDVASINHNDLPVSQVWITYITTHLDPYANPVLFLALPRPPSQPSETDEFITHITNFEAVGVKYVVTAPSPQQFDKLPVSERPTLVYRDAYMSIYQLSSPAPLFSADGGCAIRTTSWTTATATCAAPATLTYRSLTDPNWHASVNGKAVSIKPYDGLFQQMALPAGASQVSFWYEPKYGNVALLVALVGLLAIVGASLLSLWSRRQAQASRSD